MLGPKNIGLPLLLPITLIYVVGMQGDCVGLNTGNGEKKLCYSQAGPGHLLGCSLVSLLSGVESYLVTLYMNLYV